MDSSAEQSRAYGICFCKADGCSLGESFGGGDRVSWDRQVIFPELFSGINSYFYRINFYLSINLTMFVGQIATSSKIWNRHGWCLIFFLFLRSNFSLLLTN